MPWNSNPAKVLTDDELKLILETAKTFPDNVYTAIILAYNAAMRITEVLHCKVSDFDFRSSTMAMYPLKKSRKKKVVDEVSGEIKILPAKRPERAMVHMPDTAMEVVRKYVASHELPGDSYLFPGKARCTVDWCEQGHAHRQVYHEAFRAILNKLGIYMPERGIHTLKHARLTHVAMATKDPFKVQRFSRHSSIEMAAHYVNYVQDKDIVKAVGGMI